MKTTSIQILGAPTVVLLVDVHDAFVARNADKLLFDGLHPNDVGH